MKLLPVFIFSLIAVAFFSFSFGFQPRLKEDKLSDKLIKKVGDKLEREQGIFLEGIGGGSKDGKIRRMSIMLGRHGKPLNIEESRKIILNCIRLYLNEINSNKEIRPYLITYPFTERDLDIGIANSYSDGTITLDPYICDVSAAQGFVYYRTCTSLYTPFNSEYKETYEEALAKVKQSPTIPQDTNKNVDNKDEPSAAKRLEYETPVSFSARASTTSP